MEIEAVMASGREPGGGAIVLPDVFTSGAAFASATQPSPGGAILRHMKVEEIAEVVAKLPPDQLARFRRWFMHSRQATPTTPRNSTPLRPNLVASPAARLLN